MFLQSHMTSCNLSAIMDFRPVLKSHSHCQSTQDDSSISHHHTAAPSNTSHHRWRWQVSVQGLHIKSEQPEAVWRNLLSVLSSALQTFAALTQHFNGLRRTLPLVESNTSALWDHPEWIIMNHLNKLYWICHFLSMSLIYERNMHLFCQVCVWHNNHQWPLNHSPSHWSPVEGPPTPCPDMPPVSTTPSPTACTCCGWGPPC